MLGKAADLTVDQVVLDLEDGVAPDSKDQARENVIAALKSGTLEDKIRSVRVNGWTTQWTHVDVAALVHEAGPFIDSIVLPKVAAVDHSTALDLLLTQLEMSAGLATGQIRIEAQIEDAAGMAHATEIAASCARIEALVFGPADFMASIGMRSLEVGEQPAGYDVGDAYHYAFMRILVAARAAGRLAIDGPYLNIQDTTGLKRAAERSAALGFDGKWVIHPSQIDEVNATFSPRQEDYDKAELILDACAYYASRAGGQRGAATLDGEMIDEASRKMALGVAARGRAAGLERTQTFTSTDF